MSTNDPYSTPQGGQPQYGAPQGGYGQQQPQHGAPYGQQPQYGAPQQHGGMPPLAHWGQRVGAYLIDGLVLLPAYLLFLPAFIMIGNSTTTTTRCIDAGDPNSCYSVHEANGSVSPLAVVFLVLGGLVIIGLQIWNRWIKGGKGQSIGKKVLGISLISESTGRPIGTGMAFVRDLAHFLDSVFCDIGYLWPLWDAKRQTFSDKVMGTVVIQGPPPGDRH